MATSYSTLLGLALPVQGELSGTWGDTVNNYITNYLDAAVAGTQTLSTDADVTLTKTTGTSLGATSSQYAVLNCTGARTAQRTITAPAASKTYAIINATTGGFAVKLVGAGPTTGITIANGEKCLAVWNGSDFTKIALQDGAGSFTTLNSTGLAVTGTTTSTSGFYVDTGTNAGIYSNGASGLNFRTNTTLVGTWDSAGNLGLGVTPSAWDAAFKALQVEGASVSTIDNDEVNLSLNANYSSAVWKYIGSTYATQYRQGSGTHKWYTAPSGTAGNAISFTQAMTLDASGTLTATINDASTINGVKVGYRDVPVLNQAPATAITTADAGKAIYANAAGTITIPANSSQAFPIGAVLTFINMNASACTIAITTDTMYLAGQGTTGSRTLAQYGMATAIKMTSTTWMISGSGLT